MCQKSKRNYMSRTRRAIAWKALGEFKVTEFFPHDDTSVNVSPGRVRQQKGLSSRSVGRNRHYCKRSPLDRAGASLLRRRIDRFPREVWPISIFGNKREPNFFYFANRITNSLSNSSHFKYSFSSIEVILFKFNLI